MKLSSIAALTLACAVGALARGSRLRQGPIDPGTTPNCVFYDTAYSESDNCDYFESFWGISHEDFVAWVRWPLLFVFR